MGREVVQEQPQLHHGGHELVIVFQRSVRFGAIDDRAGILIKAHLVKCNWAADYVAGQSLSAFGIDKTGRPPGRGRHLQIAHMGASTICCWILVVAVRDFSRRQENRSVIDV